MYVNCRYYMFSTSILYIYFKTRVSLFLTIERPYMAILAIFSLINRDVHFSHADSFTYAVGAIVYFGGDVPLHTIRRGTMTIWPPVELKSRQPRCSPALCHMLCSWHMQEIYICTSCVNIMLSAKYALQL